MSGFAEPGAGAGEDRSVPLPSDGEEWLERLRIVPDSITVTELRSILGLPERRRSHTA